MRIETGQGTITLKTMISVWTISAIISLPGLAVSPILGSLTKIFPHATDIEIQMLSSIPSLMIIPFIILSGYLSVGYDKVKILVIGLLIYIISGAACIFTNSITMLIILSTILGVGAGMVIPLSTGFIARLFTGKYRTAQLGISSSIANVALVAATLLTGWLAQVDWHLPFVVYLLPLVTLVMSRFLNEKKNTLMKAHDPAKPVASAKKMGVGNTPGDQAANAQTVSTLAIPKGKSYHIPALIGVMLLYLFAGYAAVTVIFNLPFVILAHKLDSSVTGTLMSVFYLAITIPGFLINKIRSVMGRYSVMISMLILGLGLTIIFLSPHVVLIGLGVFMAGFGYGFIQPFVYDKATQTASPQKSVIALAYVMAINYLTIVISPFAIDWLGKTFGVGSNSTDAFMMSAVIAFVVAVWAALRNRKFVFSV